MQAIRPEPLNKMINLGCPPLNSTARRDETEMRHDLVFIIPHKRDEFQVKGNLGWKQMMISREKGIEGGKDGHPWEPPGKIRVRANEAMPVSC